MTIVLTALPLAAMLSSSPTLAAPGLASWFTTAYSRFFLCGFFMRKNVLALHIMSGWAGTRKSGWFVVPVRQPVQSRHHDWRHVAGFIPFTTDSIMNLQDKSARNSEQTQAQNPTTETTHHIDNDAPEIGVFPNELWQNIAPDVFAKIQAGEQSQTAINPDKSSTDDPATPQAAGGIKENWPRRVSLDDVIRQQEEKRGLKPMPLESDLLLRRIAQGGHSGQFLADAFLSAYRTDKPFLHSLGELIKLDSEGFRLFHQVLHIRHVPGWRDDDLYQIEQQIQAILKNNGPSQAGIKAGV